MQPGKVVVYTMFVMMGGAFLPFIYGILFQNNAVTIFKIIGIVILLAALIVPIFDKKDTDSVCENNRGKWLYYILSAACFILNGATGIITKIYLSADNRASELQFGFRQNLSNCIILSIVVLTSLLFGGKHRQMLLDDAKASYDGGLPYYLPYLWE